MSLLYSVAAPALVAFSFSKKPLLFSFFKVSFFLSFLYPALKSPTNVLNPLLMARSEAPAALPLD